MGLFNNLTQKVFGIDIKPKSQSNTEISKRIVTDEDGSTIIDSTNPIHGKNPWDTHVIFENENDLIRKFREMSLNVYCSRAIDQIVTECISNNDDTGASVAIDLSNTSFDDTTQQEISEEFERIQQLMDFKKKGESIFRDFYIDGRSFFIKNIDKKHPEKGLASITKVDSLDIKKIKQVHRVVDPDTGAFIIDKEEEYFLYQPEDRAGITSTDSIVYSKDAIAYANSGLYLYQQESASNNILNNTSSLTRNRFIISYLYPAIKPLNQLDKLEEAQIIYRVSRSAERRIHYVDISGLAPSKGDSVLQQYAQSLKNDMSYNTNTGEIVSSSGTLNLQEDIIVPRRNGTNSAEVTSLPGATEIDKINDIEFFLKKLYKSMKVPLSRLDDQASSFLGRSSEVNRDELNFSKFCNNIRSNFDDVWLDLLKTQLILKNIISLKEWNQNYNLIVFKYASDVYISQLREIEMLQEKINILRDSENYVGKYFSKSYINHTVLGFSDEQVQKMKEEMEEEAAEDPQGHESADVGTRDYSMGMETPMEDMQPLTEVKKHKKVIGAKKLHK